MLLSVANNYTV